MVLKIKSSGRPKAGRKKKVTVPLINTKIRQANKKVCLGLVDEVDGAKFSNYWD